MAIRYEYNNANKDESKHHFNEDRDCTVVALAIATEITYDEAWLILRKNGRLPNKGFPFGGWILSTKPVINGYQLGYTNTYIPRRWTTRHLDSGYQDEPIKIHRMTVSKFIKAHPTGTYILSIDKHVTTLVNGVIHDRAPIGGKCWVQGYTTITRARQFDIKPYSIK